MTYLKEQTYGGYHYSQCAKLRGLYIRGDAERCERRKKKSTVLDDLRVSGAIASRKFCLHGLALFASPDVLSRHPCPQKYIPMHEERL